MGVTVYVVLYLCSLAPRRRPVTQHVPDDAVVAQSYEEIQDGVARRRAAEIREFPQREHSFALLVEIRSIATGCEHLRGDTLDLLQIDDLCLRPDARKANFLTLYRHAGCLL